MGYRSEEVSRTYIMQTYVTLSMEMEYNNMGLKA